ncbi:DUF488 domain-containing protein [Acidobacteria bacterium AB60]|nr:DUF488 domain-containing protein [Acidobacteria bacterium AB60]
MAAGVLFTIGHSTHTLEEFVHLLRVHGVKRVADVRSIPKSRHVPQFNGEALEEALHSAGLGYRHMADLGGRRHSRKGSKNTGWRNASFRGYADYMATPVFAEALQELMRMAQEEPTTVMCAEAVPWRCHRSLIGDALLVRGWEVRDILSAAPATVHKPTPFLRVVDGELTYPGVDE